MNMIRKVILASTLSVMATSTSLWAQTDESAEHQDDGKQMGITIEVDTGEKNSPDDSETRKLVLSIMADVMESIPEEIRSEMSEEDRAKFEQAMEAIENGDFEGGHRGQGIVINADHGGDTDLTGLVAVILLFGGPVVIVALVSWNNRRKRELVHNTIDRMVENGQEIPAELFDALDKGKGGKSSLQRGTVNVAVGVGLGIALWSIADAGVATLALIPLCIGLAQLLVWKMESRDDKLTAQR